MDKLAPLCPPAMIACLALALTACSEAPALEPPPPPSVTIAHPQRRDVQLWQQFTGTTRAFETAEVRARVTGALQAIHFEAASQVLAGQPLFTIEQDAYKAARDAAAAQLASSRAELARTESDLARIQEAIETDAVSAQDLDLAVARRDQAAAAVLGALAALEQADLDLSYTEVKAPIDGQLGRSLVDVGNLVGGGNATLLTTINRMDPIYVYFEAPERLVLQLLAQRREHPEREQERPLFYMGTAADSGYPLEGKIDYIDNQVDTDTGTITARGVLDNSSGALFPGLFVRVRVPGLILEDAILIEERAISTDLGGKFVYVLDDANVVSQRYIEIGAVLDDAMVPALSGLDGSETYLVNGILRARPGLPVTPQTRDEVR